jgi:hypothetical protein
MYPHWIQCYEQGAMEDSLISTIVRFVHDALASSFRQPPHNFNDGAYSNSAIVSLTISTYLRTSNNNNDEDKL